MPDESKYPTMRLMRCKKCRTVFAASMSGSTECPECEGASAADYRPDLEIPPEKKDQKS